MSQPQDLESVNRRALFGNETQKQDLPSITLADGTKIQTGTVGALLANIKLYDRLQAGESIEGLTKEQLEEMMSVPIPTLKKSGLLDIFPADEWIGGQFAHKSAGRVFVGKKAKELGY